VALGGGDKTDRTMAMLVIAPLDEGGHPGRRERKVRERFPGRIGAIPGRAEQRCRGGIVGAHAGSAEPRQHAEPFQGGQHGRAFHRPAGVRVYDDAVWGVGGGGTRGAEAGGRVRTAFGRLDRPANDLAAPVVQDQVWVPEHAAHRALEVRDVPAPHRVGAGGLVRWRRAPLRDRRATTVRQLLLGAQHAGYGRFRGQILPRIGQSGHDLVGREVAERRAVHRGHERGPLGRGERIRRAPLATASSISVRISARSSGA